MNPKNDDYIPPKWVQALERRIESRISQEKNPLRTNSFITRMMYWMMLILSISAILLSIAQTFFTHSFYLMIFFILGTGVWGGLYYYQRKRKKTVWDSFPVAFKHYVLKRHVVLQIGWHIIFVTLVSGTFMMLSRYIGLEDVFVPRTATLNPKQQRTMSPEEQAAYNQLARMLGTTLPSDSLPPSKKSSTPSKPSTP